MQDVEFTTSTGRMVMIGGIFMFITSVAYALDDATAVDAFRAMATVISTLALVMFLKVK